MAFVNTLCSNRFYFINSTAICKFIALLKLLYNINVGLLKYLSRSGFLMVKIIKSRSLLNYKVAKICHLN